MGNSIVKTVLGLLALIIASFLIGIMAADSAKTAAMLVFGLGALFFIVAMGRKVWMCLFLLVPVCLALPPIAEIPVAYIALSGILFYWLILSLLGYAKLIWRKLFWADILVVLFILLMMISYFRNPVGIMALTRVFNIKFDVVGGKEYVVLLFSVLSYVTYSCIPFEKERLLKVLKWFVIFRLSSAFILALISLRRSMAVMSTLEDGGMSRPSMFVTFSFLLFTFIYASSSFKKLLTSPLRLFGVLFSCLLALVSGFRSLLASFALVAISCSFIRKEILSLLLAAFVGLFGVYVLGASNSLNMLPLSMQRALCVLPGLKVASAARVDANASVEWRVQMWKWALDSRTGYIKNYTWGDGFGLNVAEYQRQGMAQSRGLIRNGDQTVYAQRGMWHSGFITTISKLGICGLVFTFVVFLYGVYMMFRVNWALQGTKYANYCMFFTCTQLNSFLMFYISAGTILGFIEQFQYFAYIKVFYNIAVDEGAIVPGLRRRKYTPMLIREDSETRMMPEGSFRRKVA